MGFWILLWKAIFIAGLVVFAGMAVWATIGGARDIKRLFRTLDEQHRKDTD